MDDVKDLNSLNSDRSGVVVVGGCQGLDFFGKLLQTLD